MILPSDAGLVMPPEWVEHELCLMAWPRDIPLWRGAFDRACQDYAAVARAIAHFEPVLIVCNPGGSQQVKDYCGHTVSITELPLDDSWLRDTGPIIVSDGHGHREAVHFGFNGWGGKFEHTLDAAVGALIGELLGFEVHSAPLVAEGGAFFVDGQGTLITTKGAVLNDNRNPGLTAADAERVFSAFLGAHLTIWLDAFPDWGTDGHIDGIAQYVEPGVIALQVPSDVEDPQNRFALANLAALSRRDSAERPISVIPVTPVGYAEFEGEEVDIPYLNFYLPNGGVIVPQGDPRHDAEALSQIQAIFPERSVVGVPGTMLSVGGGGPHCITQQVPRY